jgi:predicted acyltransferase
VIQRNESLDALRGLAILGMVLSGSIAFGILPAWMYHAQTPPPAHVFIPTLPGITWVDLVFPFFVFSLGAAIPLALQKIESKEKGIGSAIVIALRRFLLLVYFAIFIANIPSGNITAIPAYLKWIISIVAFLILCFQFYKPKNSGRKEIIIRTIALCTGTLLLFILSYFNKIQFSLFKSDIIIVLLGNMAFFGTLFWWFTKKYPVVRIVLLGILMALFFIAPVPGSPDEQGFFGSPIQWMYRFDYLKYLFIVIPGTFAGEWLLKYNGSKKTEIASTTFLKLLGSLSFLLIFINILFLFNRNIYLNIVMTILLIGWGLILLYKRSNEIEKWLVLFFKTGSFLLLLGLLFDAFQEGIKKDPANFSYYFVTAGLAFYMMIVLYSLQLTRFGNGAIHFLSLNGRNPMVAYVAGNLLVLPILNLSGLIYFFNSMLDGVSVGFLRGVIFTSIVSIITVFFTKRNWYWKT